MITLDIRPLQDRTRSGVGYYTAHIIKTLAERARHQYALFGNSATIANNDTPCGPSTEKRFFRIPNKLLNCAWSTIRYPVLENLIPETTLSYLPNINFFASYKPYIVTVHDLSFEHFPEFFSPKQRLWHTAVRPKKLLTEATHIVAVSKHTKHDIIETYHIDPSRITVAYPAADKTFFPQSENATADIRKKYDLPEKFILSLGTNEPRKNISGIVDAYEKTDTNADLVIAGGAGWRSKKLFEQIIASPKQKSIHVLGYIDEVDRPALYTSAHAFVYPSFYEGFGMPVLEAMACGTPVIASHTSSIGEVVADAGLLINPHRTNELIFALNTITNDDILHKKFATTSLNKSKKFSWEKSAEILESLFQKSH